MDPGTQLGPYEIVAPLGKGGMGEVYRARDARLERDVAVKLLPAEVATDPERLARLEREARLLAQLDHPNIAAIHGLEEATPSETDQPIRFLVMQLAEGETLADRIGRGPVQVEEALAIALQIAEGLEAAHEKGIVHRDLKPANVKVVEDAGGEPQVKILDFGLAKAYEPEGPAAQISPDLSASPTAIAATRAGVILGTAGYMSPEQAKGKSVDRRADIWAFGVVLLEMLAGERAFQGETASETLAAIIKDDPDLGRLPVGVPPSVRRVLGRCLRKDPAERFHDIADVRLLLGDATEATTEERDHGWMWPRSSRDAGLAAGLAVGGIVVGVGAMLLLGRGEPPEPPELPTRRFVVEYGDLRGGRPALSPDGRRLAYGKDGRIWVRDLDRLEKLPVPGTEGGSVPFWSPDGEWLGFSLGSDTSGSEGSIWKVRPDGTGRTMITTPAPTTLAGGAAWLPGGRIVFNTGRGELLVVPDRGGEATPFAPLGEGEADYHYVAALPDGRGVLSSLHRGDRWNSIQLVTPDGERREIATFSRHNIGALAYSPTGHIVFERGVVLLQGGLWAVPFSIEELEVTGEPFPVATGGAAPAIAGDGTLVYVVTLPPVDAELVLVDPTGEILSRVGEPRRGRYPHSALSPDGSTVVAPVVGTQGWDLWAFDLAGGAPRRLTFENASLLDSPAWSTDGSDLFFSMWRGPGDFGIYRVPAYASRPPELVVRGTMLADFTSDGGTMIYGEPAEGFEVNLWMRELDGDEAGTPLLTDVGYEVQPALSPDDRFLAYSHQDRILVRSFPDMGGPWQIGPGWSPRWSPDGTRLYYLNGDALMKVEVSTGGQFRFASPAPLFNFEMAPALLVGWPLFDVTPDGERFLMVRTTERPPGMVLVQNWPGAVE